MIKKDKLTEDTEKRENFKKKILMIKALCSDKFYPISKAPEIVQSLYTHSEKLLFILEKSYTDYHFLGLEKAINGIKVDKLLIPDYNKNLEQFNKLLGASKQYIKPEMIENFKMPEEITSEMQSYNYAGVRFSQKIEVTSLDDYLRLKDKYNLMPYTDSYKNLNKNDKEDLEIVDLKMSEAFYNLPNLNYNLSSRTYEKICETGRLKEDIEQKY